MAGALEVLAGLASGGHHDAQALPWHELRYQHTQALRAQLVARYSPATANRHLAALKGVLGEAWRLGLIPAEEYRRAVDVRGVAATTLPRGRALLADELRALFAHCQAEGGSAGARDAALLGVLYGGGLRRSEAVALDVADYDPRGGALTVRAGKGRKDRRAYLAGGAQAAVERWLAVRATAPGPLLLPVDKIGQVGTRRLNAQTVLSSLQRRARAANVAPFSPHDLRRTFVGDPLDAGADLSTVQQLAGHANISTSAWYDRRGEVAKRRAAGLLNVS